MTVLVVDDNEQNLYQLEVLLVANGYKVISAEDGSVALAKARENPPDLVISDILMPVLDGFALCREWKRDERLRRIPFIFYTATYTDEWDRKFALSLGAERFFIKPEEPAILLKAIQEVIEQAPSLPRIMPQEDETVFLSQYNEALIRKLESKMAQLEQTNRALERSMAERTWAEEKIKSQLEELKRWQEVILGREDRVQELKREVNELLIRLGEPPKYGAETISE